MFWGSHLWLLSCAFLLAQIVAAASGEAALSGKTALPSCTLDSHTHFVNVSKIKYKPQQKYGQSYFPTDYVLDTASSGTPSSVVFVEVFAEPSFNVEEAIWVQALADQQRDQQLKPSISAIVAYAPVEVGHSMLPVIQELRRKVPLLAGVRRALLDDAFGPQYADPCWFMRNSSFLSGLEVLASQNLVFELGIRRSSQFDCALRLVEQAPRNLTIVVEHLGATNMTDPEEYIAWKAYVSALAALPNTVIKIGGVPERAVGNRPYDSWTEEEVAPWILHAISAFGYERSMFDGNWFVVGLFSTFERWAEVLGRILRSAGASEVDIVQLYCSTARQTYLRNQNHLQSGVNTHDTIV